MSDLRFPMGEFVFPETVNPAERSLCVDVLRRLPADLRAALAGLAEAKEDAPYRPGGWTIRQVVHHIADSNMNAYIRMKLAATATNPTITPYDEAAWAELKDGKTAPIDLSLALLDALQARWVMFLEGLPEEAWSRTFHHPEHGDLRIDVALALYAWHSSHHVAHITALRERENF